MLGMTVIELTGKEPRFEQRHRMMLAVELSGRAVEEIGDEMGKSRNTISNWMHGRTRPDTANLREFARITGVSVRWLQTGQYTEGGDNDPGVDMKDVVSASGGTIRRLWPEQTNKTNGWRRTRAA